MVIRKILGPTLLAFFVFGLLVSPTHAAELVEDPEEATWEDYPVPAVLCLTIFPSDEGGDTARSNFEEAWPCQWEGPNFEPSATSEFLLKKLEKAVENVERG